MEPEDKTVAKRVVRDVLGLKETDSLLVFAWEHTMPVAKEIVKEARRAGADTLLLTDADDVWYDAMLNLPEEWLREPSALQQAAWQAATAWVMLDTVEDPEPLKRITSESSMANDEGLRATYEPFQEDPIPAVNLNALAAVTQVRARAYGFDVQEWYRSVLAALTVDPRSLRDRGERLARVLEGARKGRLTAPGGTDFEFEFQGSDPVLFTGEFQRVKSDWAPYSATLPSGKLSVALQQGSGEGHVASPRSIPLLGDLVRGLRWEFRDGLLAEVEAEEYREHFLRLWEPKREVDGDQLGFLTVGLNPEARYGFLGDDLVEGVVSLGIGGNEDLGGTNTCEFRFAIALQDAALEVDGKTVVEDGRIA